MDALWENKLFYCSPVRELRKLAWARTWVTIDFSKVDDMLGFSAEQNDVRGTDGGADAHIDLPAGVVCPRSGDSRPTPRAGERSRRGWRGGICRWANLPPTLQSEPLTRRSVSIWSPSVENLWKRQPMPPRDRWRR